MFSPSSSIVVMRAESCRKSLSKLLIACATVALALQSACSRQTATGSQAQLPATTATQAAIVRDPHTLRVCADPNNLPFSNIRQEGFENKLADIVARDLGAHVEYTWWAQRRGFIRNTLKAGQCDVVMGVPSGYEMALTTNPYYRSMYVFVYRKDKPWKIASFDDEILRKLKIGVQMVGDDFANTPPAHALSSRNIISNVQGFSIYGDYSKENPPADIIDAIAKNKIDVAIVWGPLGGFFAKRQKVPLEVVPVSPLIDQSFLPFAYDISLGVRRGDQEFRDQLDAILEKEHGEIQNLLSDYNIPRLDSGGAEASTQGG
jgi:mxaJ protein